MLFGAVEIYHVYLFKMIMHKFQILMIHSEEHDLVINMIQLLILMIPVQVQIISTAVIYKLIKQNTIS